MSTPATIDTKAAPNQELSEMLLNFPVEETAKFRRLLDHAKMLKRNGQEPMR